MNSLIRNTVLLVTSVTVFVVVLATLLWGWNLTVTHHADHISKLLVPSQVNIARAQRSLDQIQSDLHAQSVPAAQGHTVPFQFGVVAELDNLERYLLRIVRIAHSFDYQNAFGIPARAHLQFEAARDALLEAGELTPSRATRAMGLLEPLQHTLEQLEQIYELDERHWNEQQSQGTARSLRLMLLALALLVLTAVPFIVRLGIGLRSSIRHELRARRDLEEAKQNLEKLAMYDSVTGLGNRNLFKARLEQVVESAKRSRHVSALLYMDLDNFKRINDSLGHDAGDNVLEVAATRLQACVRSTDTVARLGGDEFTVILADVVSSASVASIAAKLLHDLRRPMNVAGTELVVSASIGITMMPADGDNLEMLMKNADMALYKAKEEGRDRFHFFVEAMHHAVIGKIAMENDLRGAIRIDALKIDRSFVRDLEKDEADRSIVDAVIAMARSLSLRVVAEGIEDAWQLRYLAANRCDMGQGFLFSRPVPAGELSVAGLGRRWAPELAKDTRSGLHVV